MDKSFLVLFFKKERWLAGWAAPKREEREARAPLRLPPPKREGREARLRCGGFGGFGGGDGVAAEAVFAEEEEDGGGDED